MLGIVARAWDGRVAFGQRVGEPVAEALRACRRETWRENDHGPPRRAHERELDGAASGAAENWPAERMAARAAQRRSTNGAAFWLACRALAGLGAKPWAAWPGAPGEPGRAWAGATEGRRRRHTPKGAGQRLAGERKNGELGDGNHAPKLRRTWDGTVGPALRPGAEIGGRREGGAPGMAGRLNLRAAGGFGL
jgi:hypothetical protein